MHRHDAEALDAADPLAGYRQAFDLPDLVGLDQTVREPRNQFGVSPGRSSGLHIDGDVKVVEYDSKTLGTRRQMRVYTPPGYGKSGALYPALYLVSGTTDTEETWFKVGRANFILDNLIAGKKAVPMILVMPFGNMMSGTPMPNSPQAAEMYQGLHDIFTGRKVT